MIYFIYNYKNNKTIKKMKPEETFECIIDESQEIMTKKDLIQFLKDNLSISVDAYTSMDDYDPHVSVTLYLCGKEITSSYV